MRERQKSHIAALAGTIILLDQISKGWVLIQFTARPRILEITSFLNVILTWNHGISFGFFNHTLAYGSRLFMLFSLLIIIFLIVWMRYTHIPFIRFAICTIIGGAFGNALDRLRHNGVVDFLDFYVWSLHWPAFNMADLAITIGAMALIADSVLRRKAS